ncbi:LUD domain-containing protein (plasmid) [Rhodococcus pseudokoreensis]|uniref:LUD domain-containing protein n=1 Tax=Rhodococcus pseudokoreensis TaxID=2811421 RepID=A0A974ZRM4_9NOCA|nr:LUD domain-containing protein [Rhodococcus pseudokoreensis]QSE87836.1 LUD domain-containing protein [Rhodococcus pseudokoreensis]
MSDARTAILHRVRDALSDRPMAGDIPRDYDLHRDYPDLLELAQERIADYKADVRRVSPAQVGTEITAALARRGAARVIAPPGLPTDWRTPEVTWLDDTPLGLDELDAADAVVTGCAVTIAETGTIVLDAGPTQGRRALTLVPDYHLCVIEAHQVVATVPEALARLDTTRPLTFISGPSATSDIELDRVEGVHGPRTLDVLLIES